MPVPALLHGHNKRAEPHPRGVPRFLGAPLAGRARRTASTYAEVAGYGLRLVAAKADQVARRLEPPRSAALPKHDWPSGAPSAVALDRAGTAAWALTHVDDEPSVHSNCAYFVSDALRLGGGLAPTPLWIPGTSPARVHRSRRISSNPAYGCVGDFVLEMQRAGYARLIGVDSMLPSVADAQLGDVIVYNWDGRGHFQHLAVVTAFEDGVMRVTQQTPSQRNRPWNRFGNGGWISSALWLQFATARPPQIIPDNGESGS